MTNRRTTPFNEDHIVEYGLEIATKSANTNQVDSVRCKFCIVFGKEGSSFASGTRKRKVTENIKYFRRPFCVDNYKSHLKTHSVKFAEYQALTNAEKKVFFNTTKQKYVNTLDAHYGIQQKEHTFFFGNDIVENVILRRQQNLTQTMK